MAQPEKIIENQILNFLKAKRVFVFKVKTTGTFDPTKKVFRRASAMYMKGVSDILGIFNHRFMAIEVKSAKGRLSDEQKIFLQRVSENGGIAIVARSVEDVEQKLFTREIA